MISIAAFLVLFSALIVRGMIEVGVIDHPGARSSHTRPTPKGGGVGIVAAFAAGVWLWPSGAVDLASEGVLAAVLGLALVSYMDDVRGWPFAIKLAAQVVAAMVAVACGFRLRVLHLPGLGAFDLGVFGGPLSVAWILFATNAMNFIDGVNGLAAGSSAIACVFLGAIAWGQGQDFVAGASVALGCGILGFLPFNFPCARIFMGDVGSQSCGLVLAVLGLAASRFGPQTVSVLLVPMLLFGILFDVVFTLLRRTWRRDSLTEAHRGHLYQVAHRAGMEMWTVTLVYWGMTLWGGVCCLLFERASPDLKTIILLMVAVLPLVWLWYVKRIAHRAGIGRW